MLKALLVPGLLTLGLLSCSWGLAYAPLELGELADVPATLQLVRVQGIYTADAETVALVRGVVTGDGVSGDGAGLQVEGTVFDWTPRSGTPVDLWGRLETRAGKPVLTFHKGRDPGDARRPHPTPAFSAGEHLELQLRVSAGGSLPFPVAQGLSEDRLVFLLPRYRGPTGLVCVTGRVGYLAVTDTQRLALTSSRPCRERGF